MRNALTFVLPLSAMSRSIIAPMRMASLISSAKMDSFHARSNRTGFSSVWEFSIAALSNIGLNTKFGACPDCSADLDN